MGTRLPDNWDNIQKEFRLKARVVESESEGQRWRRKKRERANEEEA